MSLWDTGLVLWALQREARRGLPTERLDELLREIDRSECVSLPIRPGWIIASLRRARRMTGVRDTCLVRSVAGYAALRRLGHAPRFVIGVDREGAGFVAHAWIELDGLRTDPSAERFTPIFRHPSPESSDRHHFPKSGVCHHFLS